MNIDDMVSKFVEISRAHNQKDDFSENEYNSLHKRRREEVQK